MGLAALAAAVLLVVGADLLLFRRLQAEAIGAGGRSVPGEPEHLRDIRRLRWAEATGGGRGLVPSQILPTIRINRAGFRGRDVSPGRPPGAMRIVLLGNSTAFGVGASSDTATFAVRLEAGLRERWNVPVEVVNLALPRRSVTDDLEIWKRIGRPLRPQIVVLLAGYQDVMRSIFGETPPRRPAWSGVGDGLASLWRGVPPDRPLSPLEPLWTEIPGTDWQLADRIDTAQLRELRELREISADVRRDRAVGFFFVQPLLSRSPHGAASLSRLPGLDDPVDDRRLRTLHAMLAPLWPMQRSIFLEAARDAEGSVFVDDLGDRFPESPTPLFCDSVHLTDEGHRWFADVAAGFIGSKARPVERS